MPERPAPNAPSVIASERALVTTDGVPLWTRLWAPQGPPRATGVLVHGLGEHSGRYAHVGETFARAGYALHAFDLRGHGRSSGRRGDTRLGPALDDVERLLAETESRYPAAPRFVYGHSLGALIVLTLLARRRPRVAAAVASAPPLRSALREQKAKVALARVLGRVLPRLRVASGIDATALSRDPAVVEAYRADPLVHGLASMGFGADALAATDALAELRVVGVPLLLLHGTADRIAFVEGSRTLAGRLAGDVTYRELAGVFHECHNEPEKDALIGGIVAWLDRQLPPATR
jgi:acylglycerol lipase